MTGHPDRHVSSVMPLNARTARIASGGSLVACSCKRLEKIKVAGESGAPDGLDIVERRAGEAHPSRVQT